MTEQSNLSTLEIARLGQRGDGMATDGTIVPYALPGERVSVRRDGARVSLVAVETPSPDRIAPFCGYFGTCGGCAVQHLAPEPYAAWKRGNLAQGLAQAGIEVPCEPTRDAHGSGRRRLTLHVREIDGKGVAGLMEARSHALVAIDHCPITVEQLHRAPAVARALSAPLGHGRKPLDVAFTATEAGLDVDLRGHGPVSEGLRATLVRLAGELDLARLSLHGDIVVERRAPAITTSGARLVPPPGGFLQATEAGEAMLAELVVAALDKRVKRVVDLFAGAGPFTLAMARTRDVHAVEGEAAAIASLDRAFRSTPGLRRITSETRDLFRGRFFPSNSKPTTPWCSIRRAPARRPGQTHRGGKNPPGHRGRLRHRFVRARCRDPDRGGLSTRTGRSCRPVQIFEPSRNGGRVPEGCRQAQALAEVRTGHRWAVGHLDPKAQCAAAHGRGP